MNDGTIERRMDRVSFRHLVARAPVKMLALEAVAGFLAVTRKSGEERIAESCLRCYCLNALDNNYARDVEGHCGVHVFAAGKSKESGRTSTGFFMHFAEFVRPLDLHRVNVVPHSGLGGAAAQGPLRALRGIILVENARCVHV